MQPSLQNMEYLLEDCDVDFLEQYKDWQFSEEISQLVYAQWQQQTLSVKLISELTTSS